jgi:hypothetical protein
MSRRLPLRSRLAEPLRLFEFGFFFGLNIGALSDCIRAAH